MAILALANKLVITGLWFLLLFVGERLRRSARPPESSARLRRNAGLWLLLLVTSPLIVAPLTAWGANHVFWMRPDWMTSGASGAVILIVDLILLDLWMYWLHRAYHEVGFMWRFHEIHHRDEFLDTTSAFRFHFGEIILSAALRLLPIAILALPLKTVILFETILLCASIFHHSNIRLPERMEKALSRIIVTPGIHWVHHHALKRDTNANYASILSLWDRIFCSKSSHVRSPDMKIGVEGVEDKPVLGLMLMPFKR